MANRDEKNDDPSKTNSTVVAPLCCSSRLVVTIVVFFGCLMTYILRLNLGFALVCMVEKNISVITGNETRQETSKECDFLKQSYKDLNQTRIPHEFDWSKSLQGYLLGAFFNGYILTQIASGWLCEKVGGKIILGVGMGIVSLMTLAIPEVSRVSPYFLLAIRILQGMFSAAAFPAFHSLIGHWAPPSERGLLLSLTYSGMYVGTLVTFPLCGLLCDYGFAGGWPSVFYVTGIIGVVWVVMLIFFVYDKPDKHPRISKEEKNYLENTLDTIHHGHHLATEKFVIPWKSILKSGPVWAISIAHLGCNWGLYTLVLSLPSYMTEVHKFPIKENGFLSALPYICSLIVNLVCGKLTDVLLQKKVAKLTIIRKIFNTIGMLVPGLCFLVLTFLDCNHRYLAVGVVVLLQSSATSAYAGGFFFNHVDIAPEHAGILMGITNMFGTISGILSPALLGVLTPDGTLQQWSIVFYISMGIYIVGAIVYAVLGSAEQQPWASPETRKHHMSKLLKRRQSMMAPIE